jgi:hypothetical protein
MKDKIIVDKDVLEIRKNVQEEKKHVFIGSLRKQPNLRVFEASLVTGNVFFAKMELIIDAKGKATHIVKTRENHIYCYALNAKNAMRKFQKMLNNGR